MEIRAIKDLAVGMTIDEISGEVTKSYKPKTGRHPEYGKWQLQGIEIMDGTGSISVQVKNHFINIEKGFGFVTSISAVRLIASRVMVPNSARTVMVGNDIFLRASLSDVRTVISSGIVFLMIPKILIPTIPVILLLSISERSPFMTIRSFAAKL